MRKSSLDSYNRTVLLRDNAPQGVEIRLELSDVVLQSGNLIRCVIQSLSRCRFSARVATPRTERDRSDQKSSQNSHSPVPA